MDQLRSAWTDGRTDGHVILKLRKYVPVRVVAWSAHPRGADMVVRMDGQGGWTDESMGGRLDKQTGTGNDDVEERL